MSAKNYLRYLAVAALLGLPAVLLTGCNRSEAKATPPPPPSVTIAPVEQREVTEWDEFTGRTEAVEAVEVRPRVSGHIQEVRFQSGQLVKKGDVLFVIDPRWYQAEFDRRQAELEQAKARLANSELVAARAAKLLASKTISNENADTSTSQLAEDKAGVMAAKSILESARLDLDFTEIRAPIDGRVSRALLTTGNYVSGVAGAASILTTLVSVDPIYVYAYVDENSLLKFNELAGVRKAANEIKVPVELALANEEGFPHHGYIESFDNRLDPNTGTILLRAVFSNEEGRLVPGLFARIRMSAGGRHSVLLVDESSIGTDQAQKFVLALAKGNTVEYRKITLGPVIDGKRIVREGLQPGEKIVVNGLQRARPGSEITPEMQVAAIPPSAPQTAER
ncbi:MAG: efflux RND transporter periplasmic adaptor subunit [Chthoniobacteraceae bacterium]